MLKEYIAYYYVFKADEDSFKEHFIHFPHYRNTLNIYFDSDVQFSENGRIIKYDSSQHPVAVISNYKIKFRTAHLSGPIRGIGIGFKPLGICQFLKPTFKMVPTEEALNVDEWFYDFDAQHLSALTQQQSSSLIPYLDQLLLSNFQDKNLDKLLAIVEEIIDQKGKITVNDLAERHFMSRRTLLRLFQKHMACTVEVFKSLIRFRSAMDSFQVQQKKPYLTELAHQNNYYDQSDFIHHFKSIAGDVPRKILQALTQVGQNDMYWLFPGKDKLSQ